MASLRFSDLKKRPCRFLAADPRPGNALRRWNRRQMPIQAVNDLEVTHKRLPNSRVELTLTLSPEATQKNYDAFLRKVQASTQVPGFRKGQSVPLQLLIQHRGGEEAFRGELLQTLIEQSAEKALQDWQGQAIQDSDRLETSVQELLKTFEPDEPLQFCISFDVQAELKWTAPYKDLKVEVRESGDDETDSKNVETYIRTMLKQRGTQRVVMDRGMEMGDIAILDFEFVRPDNRESLPHLNQEKFRFDTDLPDTLGVVDKVLGIRVGDVREFELKFPDTWEPAVYRGIEALAIVTCHELFSWELPELTDDFVQSLQQPSLDTVADFRGSMLEAEASRRAESLKDSVQDALMQELVKIVDMDVSETAIMETAKVKYQTMLLEMQSKGRLGKDALDNLATPEMLSNYMISHRSELENDQKGIAAMQAVFKELELEVTEEEIQTEVESAIQGFQSLGEEYDRERLMEMAGEILHNSKVVEWFTNNGNIKILPFKEPVPQT